MQDFCGRVRPLAVSFTDVVHFTHEIRYVLSGPYVFLEIFTLKLRERYIHSSRWTPLGRSSIATSS